MDILNSPCIQNNIYNCVIIIIITQNVKNIIQELNIIL